MSGHKREVTKIIIYYTCYNKLFTIFFRYHHVYFDNFFASIMLIIDLLKEKIYACDTLRSNRSFFPEQFKKHLKKGLGSRGDFVVAQFRKAIEIATTSAKSLAVILWQDNKPVVVVSSNCDPSATTTVQRRQKDGTQVAIPCPESVYLYNRHMGGVDLNDQLRGYYHVRLKGRKFYKYIFWFLFDVAITNSYILCKHHSNLTTRSLKQFRMELAQALLGDYNGRKRRGRPSAAAPPQRICTTHFPTKHDKKNRCQYCYHHRHERHETHWYCSGCAKYLCHNDCFLLYHNSI